MLIKRKVIITDTIFKRINMSGCCGSICSVCKNNNGYGDICYLCDKVLIVYNLQDWITTKHAYIYQNKK